MMRLAWSASGPAGVDAGVEVCGLSSGSCGLATGGPVRTRLGLASRASLAAKWRSWCGLNSHPQRQNGLLGPSAVGFGLARKGGPNTELGRMPVTRGAARCDKPDTLRECRRNFELPPKKKKKKKKKMLL